MGTMRKIKYLLGSSRRKLSFFLIKTLPFLSPVYKTRNHSNPITVRMWFLQKILGFNRHVYWPVHISSVIIYPKKIFMLELIHRPAILMGVIFRQLGRFISVITLVLDRSNVGIISSNHNLLDFRNHKMGEITIGKYCWIGMNSVILPDVTLGDFTVVMAGSVVNTSFPQGYCVVGGNPAKLMKQFPEESQHLFVRFTHEHEYNGYIRSDKFESYRKKHLNV